MVIFVSISGQIRY